MEVKHTPGPWERADTADYAEIWPSGNRTGSAIALVGAGGDANLIAAAPDLLDLLKRANEADSADEDIRTAWWEEHDAAIAKAGGRS